MIVLAFRKYNYLKRAEKKMTSKSYASGFKTILAGYFLGLYTVVRKHKEF